eukprot:CAMPEP_0115021528 /NCGR_PEP_ID=MMETSP0216-20121206/30949_1 /TAXON_ID=223996 /ORGANISM="Protocruzia adherens, Strain Boccale" /LENGTH=193 /DNA_ID=CAMNT_0002393919 /DNA_START=37 /DNA_END=618 /DNA_ORIENTATION=+
MNNIQPRTREERAGIKNKESIEKTMLKNRSGGYHKYEDPAGIINNPDHKSPIFVSEAERFDKNFAVFDKKQRDGMVERKDQFLEQKRMDSLNRDLGRWKRMDEENKTENERVSKMREDGSRGKKNHSSAAYNPITLEYDPTSEGQRLKQKDDYQRYKQAVRMQNLDAKSNGSYNILTGENRRGVDVPDPNRFK